MEEAPNKNYIQQLANGNLDFELRLIQIMKREFPEEKQLFLKRYNANDYPATAEIVHKLKNKIGMLGLEDGYQTAVDFENELKMYKTKLYPKFIVILEKMEHFISTL